MEAEYGARYRELFERHWWWRAREEVVLRALRTHLPGQAPSVLDVGCGDGLFFDALREQVGAAHVEGVEPAAGLVRTDGPHRGRIHVQPFDATFQPGRRYSMILMLDVLEHLADPVAALRHARSLLEPGGRLLVTVPALQVLWTRHDDLNHHFMRHSSKSLRDLAREAGLHVEQLRYFFRWMVLPKLLLRGLEALLPGDPRPPAVPPAPVNRALRAVSQLEERLLSRSRLPFGSSLLMVASAGGRA